jgi:hypothetical protein
MVSKRKRFSRRVASRHVLLTQQGGGAGYIPAAVVHPPKERGQHGTVLKQERTGDQGQRLIASVVDNPSAFDQLALAGVLGDDDVCKRLVGMADWFRERAEILNLRAFVTARFERQSKGRAVMTPRQSNAAKQLGNLAQEIGASHYNRLFDLLVWDILPLVPHRQRKTIEALHAAAAYLKL